MRVAVILYILALIATGCKEEKPLPAPVPDSLEVVDDSIEVNYEAQTITLNFATNREYSFEVGAEWITPVESRSVESYELSFAIAENVSPNDRSSFVKIVAGGVESHVSIIQRGAPERMTLKLTHSDANLAAPMWHGEDVTGRVEWGDGESDKYAEGISHAYASEGATAYEALFDMRGAEGFRIPVIGEISHIEIGVELAL